MYKFKIDVFRTLALSLLALIITGAVLMPTGSTESAEALGNGQSIAAIESGFNSDFNTTHANWITHKGYWANQSLNYYVTAGVANNWSSISYDATYTTLTYQVKMKRSGCVWCANHLAIRGTPLPLGNHSQWKKEYVFEYTNSGNFSVWKLNGLTQTALKPWATSSTIAKNDWNTLKVTASGGTFKFYINGILVWAGTNAAFSSGRVGIGMYRDSTSSGNKLSVDWAKLTLTVPAAADEAVNPMTIGEEIPGGDSTGQP